MLGGACGEAPPRLCVKLVCRAGSSYLGWSGRAFTTEKHTLKAPICRYLCSGCWLWCCLWWQFPGLLYLNCSDPPSWCVYSASDNMPGTNSELNIKEHQGYRVGPWAQRERVILLGGGHILLVRRKSSFVLALYCSMETVEATKPRFKLLKEFYA